MTNPSSVVAPVLPAERPEAAPPDERRWRRRRWIVLALLGYLAPFLIVLRSAGEISASAAPNNTGLYGAYSPASRGWLDVRFSECTVDGRALGSFSPIRRRLLSPALARESTMSALDDGSSFVVSNVAESPSLAAVAWRCLRVVQGAGYPLVAFLLSWLLVLAVIRLIALRRQAAKQQRPPQIPQENVCDNGAAQVARDAHALTRDRPR